MHLKVLITLFQKTLLNFFRKWYIGVRATVHEVLRIKIFKKMLTQQKFHKIFLLQTLIVIALQNSIFWENVRRHFRCIYVNYKKGLRFFADNTISNNLRTITIIRTKKEALDRISFLELITGKEGDGVNFFRGVAVSTWKTLKYLMTKKVYKQKRFSLS